VDDVYLPLIPAGSASKGSPSRARRKIGLPAEAASAPADRRNFGQ